MKCGTCYEPKDCKSVWRALSSEWEWQHWSRVEFAAKKEGIRIVSYGSDNIGNSLRGEAQAGGAINRDGFVHNLQSADGRLSGPAEKDIMPIHIRVDVTLPSVMICSFKVPLSYANAEFFMHEALSLVSAAPPSPRWFILRFDSIGEVDYVAAKMLMELADRMEREQATLGFTELSPDVRSFLSDSGVLDIIGSDKVFASVHEACTPIKNSALSDGQAPKL